MCASHGPRERRLRPGQAGEVYEMQTPEMVGKTYEECLPFVRDSLKDRMQWIWTGNIDDEYEARKASL